MDLSSSTSQRLSLLTTKLYIPPTRPDFVSRPRLIERLNAGMTCKLTLISAPTGFGKTTLLSEWIKGRLEIGDRRLGSSETHQSPISDYQPFGYAQDKPPKFAWLSLDEGDNDPVRFLAYFVTALQTIEANIGDTPLAGLQSAQPPPLETLLTGVINEIAAVSAPLTLVFDDYHTIEAQLVHDALTFLLDHMPPQLHLIIATRVDPPLPIARLRGRGQLTELRADDLRFTVQEATSFLNEAMGLNLSAADVDALETRTEGWVVGLQMASLAIQARSSQARFSMPGQEDVSEFIEAFSGSHRFILDYLREPATDNRLASFISGGVRRCERAARARAAGYFLRERTRSCP
ncbi:MAG: HTH-type transcriptional regulator MalT [Anaerolineales bacterium]|nr:HTH-type transcriptional regulator MalT [Anaerolineales bacterium]